MKLIFSHVNKLLSELLTIFQIIFDNILLTTPLKKKIEKNSTWECAFYQSEWVKIYWSGVTLVFSRYVCFCYCIRIVWYCSFSKYWTLFIPFQPFILSIKFYTHVNFPAWADEYQLNEKVRFLSEMSETHFLALKLIFVSSSWWVYMCRKLDI